LSKKNNPQKKSSKKNTKNNKKNTKKILSILLIMGIIIGAVLILFSDLFNVTKITVINNSKVGIEEIIQNSGITVGNNMFKFFKIKGQEAIKANPYIENVDIDRKLNGEIIIEVKERIATFMLQKENGYIYINNQGYFLEEAQVVLPVPMIKGYKTEDLTIGNRLNVEDLKKLDIVIQIMEAAKSKGIQNIITTIDISDRNNFILEIPSEGKIVQFGNEENITVKMLWILDLLSREKGIEGEIVVNVEDIKKVYFREKV